jgi:leucyl aminopeptidase
MNILIISKQKNSNQEKFKIKTYHNMLNVLININDISITELIKNICKIKKLLEIQEINNINIISHNKDLITNHILSFIHNQIHEYNMNKMIKYYNIDINNIMYMKELTNYKNIVMNPNKTPPNYLQYILKNIPKNYSKYVHIIKKNDTKNMFPLIRAVGAGSSHNSYFVHIYPENIDNNKKTIYMIGKAVTFDSGGLNLKFKGLKDMKIDMTGSALILSVLKLLNINNLDTKYNINLLIPIVENMIDNSGTLSGTVVKTMNDKTVEIVNTDAEGRLCIADCIDYINKFLIKNNMNNSIILDVATLTHNNVTHNISSLVMCNMKGKEYADMIINIGETIGEYVDYLQLREEYMSILKSKVADIKSLNESVKVGTIIGGTFISYFCNNSIPWIHLDVGECAYDMNEEVSKSYGINLLYTFIKNL